MQGHQHYQEKTPVELQGGKVRATGASAKYFPPAMTSQLITLTTVFPEMAIAGWILTLTDAPEASEYIRTNCAHSNAAKREYPDYVIG